MCTSSLLAVLGEGGLEGARDTVCGTKSEAKARGKEDGYHISWNMQ